MGVSLIVPTLNERGNLPLLIKRLKGTGVDEVIFIDDGSDDGTFEFLKTQPDVKVIKRWNADFSSAFLEGVKAASQEWLILMDADLQHPPEIIPQMISRMDKCDVVVASRYAKGGGIRNWSLFRLWISKMAVFMFRLIPDIRRTTDPMSGFFAVKKRMVPPIPRGKGFKVLVEILKKNPNARVCDVPYVFQEREKGKSKISIWLVIAVFLQWLECLGVWPPG